MLAQDRIALAAFVYLAVLVLVAVLGGVLVGQDPHEQDLRQRLLRPAPIGGTPAHVLGTDALGRDLGARLVAGTRLTLLIPLIAVVIAGVLGTALGLIAGFYGGKADAVIMRVVDSMMAFSALLLMIVVAVMLGTGVRTLILVFGLTGWVVFTRAVRGMTLALREAPYVLAARSAGCTNARILVAHVLPSSMPVIMSLVVLDMGRFMIAEAGLSFLGFGVQPPDLTWGLILQEGRQYLSAAVWLVAFPGLAISLTVFAATVFGAWLRSVTDPFQRQATAPTPRTLIVLGQLPAEQ